MDVLQKKLATAFAKHQAGDVGTAATLYRAVLEADPQQPDALHMMGVIAQQKGNTKLGLELIALALAHKPDMALAWHNQSLLLRVTGRHEEALQSAKQALSLDAKMADAWDMAGSILRELGRTDEAALHYAHAMKLQPENERYRSNYSVLMLGQGDLMAAYNAVKDTEKLGHDTVSFALGNVLRTGGYPELAIPHYQRVRRLLPHSAEVRMNEAMAWLLLGEMERAWELWKGLPDEREDLKHIRRWQGEKVGHLLLHEEQGLGDALQCVRYIPLIKNRAEKVTLRLSGFLKRLMQENFPDCEVLSLEEPAPQADARAQLMQLPALLGTNLNTIPAHIPYLCANGETRAIWRERVASIPSPRFGLVWMGNPNHRNNANRSIPLSEFAPLLAIGQKHGLSLQKWGKKDEVALADTGLFDADFWMEDFAASAALIMELDLVITVDTSVAHLAGALGKPVWVLIPFDPDWRWMLGREDSPWYPTMRLYRQEIPRDWSSVLKRMADDLKKLLHGDRSVLKPHTFTGPPLRQNPLAIQFPN